ncbi:MAG: TetR/AcrR family transcriptional regulator [Actinomycetota bacterium]
MAAQSKTAMVTTAAELFRRQGYEATSWRQLVAESGAPAGSIGYHFPGGKEQLAVEVVVEASNSTHDLIDALLGSDEEPVEMMRRWIGASARVLESSGYANGCPLATMALELAHRSDDVQQQIAAGYDRWVELLADRLEPTHGAVAHDTAVILLSAFEGALLLSRARRSTAPLDLLAERALELLGALQSAPG